MMNPFKYGVLVDNEYFTDRSDELKEVAMSLNSANHLILISPRRFGKSSLVAKAVKATGRPSISLNMQNVLSVEDLASKLLRELFRLYPMERIKHLMTHFRIIPTVSTNPMTGMMDVSFQPVVNSIVLLEDAMALIEKVSNEGNKLVVVLDEFRRNRQTLWGDGVRMLTQNCCQTIHEEWDVSNSFYLCPEAFDF